MFIQFYVYPVDRVPQCYYNPKNFPIIDSVYPYNCMAVLNISICNGL